MAFGGSWLYHKSCPVGRIFKDEGEYLAHLKIGWVEAPWLIDDPIPVAVEVAPEPVIAVAPVTRKVAKPIKPKKPGRPSKKVERGK